MIIITFLGGRNMPNKLKNILDEYVQGLFKIIGDDLEQIILYGSYARGEQSNNDEVSDIDIMILVKTENNEIKNLERKILDYSYDLDLQYNIILSPIIENVDTFNSKAKYIPFYKNVLKEGVLLNG